MAPRNNRELIAGPFQPVLEDALAAALAAAKKRDPGAPALVLVGSNLLALYLRRRIAESLPLWNVHFFNFNELARKLGADHLRAQGRAPLPELAEPLIVRSVVEKVRSDYFAPVADLPGFIRVAAASIRDLKEAGLGPQALRAAAGPKLDAFARIFRGYEAALARLGFYDEADLLAAAAEAANTADATAANAAKDDADATAADAANDDTDATAADSDVASDLVAQSAFIAYGFYDLNGLQRRLLLAVAARAKSTAVMVPALDAPACEYAKPLIAWLGAQGFRARPRTAADRPGVAPRLFAPPAGAPLDPARTTRPATVRILSAPGDPQEVREAVRQVLEFAERGIPLDEIAVLLRDREAYARPLREAFALAGIPCFVSGGVPLAETREAKSLELLAALVAGELPRAAVMQFLHFAPLDLEKLLGRQPNLADWDLLSIEAGIVEGPDEWLRRLGALREPADDGRADRHRAELPHLKTFIRELIRAKQSVPREGPWRDIAGALLRVYENLLAPSELRDRVALEVRKLFALDKVADRTTLDGVRDGLADLFASRSVPAGGFQRGCVTVADLFEARGLSFRAAVIPGLVEKVFPAAGRQDPILLDAERELIAKRPATRNKPSSRSGPSHRSEAGAYLPPKSARSAEERMLFALAVSSAADLALTYPRLDVTAARERIPSHFLTRLVEALTGARCDYSSLERAECFLKAPMFPRATDRRTALDPNDYDLQQIAECVAAERPADALYLSEISEPFRRGIEVESARWREKRFTRFDGLVGAAAAPALTTEVMAPTRIELYARCPFAYFLDRVLGLEPLEEPEKIERIEPLERGLLLHRVFQRAYAERFGRRGAASAAELFDSLRRAAEAEFRGPFRDDSCSARGPALTWAIDRAEILADLARWAALDAAELAALDAHPAFLETRFGMPPRGHGPESTLSTDQPLVLDVGAQACRFKGRIDRIDELAADRARVIDYKTGKKTGTPNAFLGGQAVQLPIYLLAAQMLLPARTVLLAEYAFATARGKFSSVEFTSDALDERMDDLRRIIETVEDGIARGLFVATPDNDRCGYCGFRDACGASKDVLFDRKKDDPAIAALRDMAEIE